ncbi:MAG: glycoside hydrolase family 1 protein [Candidatus Omnitrophica bacterium]|nr:glycoside hydrolase family 1 protein [Candidatus Omnitrophota bacterium]
MTSKPPLEFPKNFLWGAATSSHQVEGGNRLNDWWEWEEAGKVKEKSGDACRHYSLYARDFDLAKSLHHNAHRLSIEWSRVEPEPGRWDEDAIRHYAEVLKALRARGLEPVVTLHHFTLPVWLARLGGWASEECVSHFERYVNKMATALGGQVTYWITINEPLVFIYLGYIIGEWPPGEQSPMLALAAFRHFILAHGRAYQIIHGVYEKTWKTRPLVSFAQHVAHHVPCSPYSLRDRFSALMRHLFFMKLPFDALTRGYLFFPGIFCEKLPFKNTLDYVGINYYTREFIHFTDLGFPGIFGDMCSLKHHRDIAKRNQMGWESYPEGLYRTLMEVRPLRLPVLITENGSCTPDDADRWEFIRTHVAAVHKAMTHGVPMIGYLYWSLLDNFEWAQGFGPRFGLVEVDYASQERKIRPSAIHFSRMCETRRLE